VFMCVYAIYIDMDAVRGRRTVRIDNSAYLCVCRVGLARVTMTRVSRGSYRKHHAFLHS